MKQRIHEILCENRQYFTDLADYIWANPELGFREYKSVAALKAALVEHGFEVTDNLAGIETAFKGVYGSGYPVIGWLGEYDALAGISQEAGCEVRKPVKEGAPGHGCGHNAICTGSIAAAVAVKKIMEENNLPGTLIVYGCPAEEQGSGKAFMARAGVFEGLDIALAPHPGYMNKMVDCGMLANVQVEFKFKGKAAHAAAVPHLGRSALDACSLMIVGTQFLREHIIQEARIHHAYINTGGTSPNVVQADASLLFYIRAPKSKDVLNIFERMKNIAEGAALMTDTTLEVLTKSGMTELVNNITLGKVMEEAWKEVGPCTYSEASWDLARRMEAVCGGNPDDPLDTHVPDYNYSDAVLSASTDVGDVSYLLPSLMMLYTTVTRNTPGHGWQYVALTGSSLLHEGMMHNAEVMALAAVKMLQDPTLVEKAWEEHRAKNLTYECMIPDDVEPEAQAE